MGTPNPHTHRPDETHASLRSGVVASCTRAAPRANAVSLVRHPPRARCACVFSSKGALWLCGVARRRAERLHLHYQLTGLPGLQRLLSPGRSDASGSRPPPGVTFMQPAGRTEAGSEHQLRPTGAAALPARQPPLRGYEG